MSDPSNWRVLVVEDQEDSVQVLSQILRFHGCEVLVAGNGQECLTVLAEVQPTLVLMDLAMPGMDGWSALASIRSNPRTRDLCVVAVTAYYSVNVAEDALTAGFDACFPKPVGAATLVADLQTLLLT